MSRATEYLKNLGPMEDFIEYMEGNPNSTYFNVLPNMKYDADELLAELSSIVDLTDNSWGKDQLHISNVPGHEDNLAYSYGSLIVDHAKSKPTDLHFYDEPIEESTFSSISTIFKNTTFEKIHSELTTKYKIGRFRIMTARPSGCLSWHRDANMRIHFPIKTQRGCFMVINNETQHLKKGVGYFVNTKQHHTAVNASRETRIHLVANVLS